MRLLAVHPGPLMYTKIFLRLEPLGLELVAQAARQAGHEVRLLDLQVESQDRYLRTIDDWRPHVVAFSCNYLANIPEIVDLAKETKRRWPDIFVFVGGHSVSFTAAGILEHAEGAIDCVLKGEGEASVADLLLRRRARPGGRTPHPRGRGARWRRTAGALRRESGRRVAGARSSPSSPQVLHGHARSCASIEFSRGCPWDCSFCSAWTFYGRSYRTINPERAVEDLARIKEPGVFIVDDVAFIQERHGLAIGEAIARKGIKKKYYLETRGDVLLRNKEVFKFWKGLGVEYMFLGLEAIDEEGLKKYRKRVPLGTNFEALEFARSLGIAVAINIIADPDWDEERFRVVRAWCLEVPEVVNISINTPYPGTESWLSEARRLATRDYRLFDIQHAVLPTRLPLDRFYRELVETQRVLNMKHLGARRLWEASGSIARLLLRGQTNFLRTLWKFNSVYNADLLLADHALPVRYEIPLPPPHREHIDAKTLYIHTPRGRRVRAVDLATERFVD